MELGEVAVVVGTRRPDGLRTEGRWRRRDEEELEIRVKSGSPALSEQQTRCGSKVNPVPPLRETYQKTPQGKEQECSELPFEAAKLKTKQKPRRILALSEWHQQLQPLLQ